MEFSKLVGQELGFHGICGNAFKVGKYVFEAIEDESDGCRSYLGSIEVKDPSGLNFFRRSISKVKIVESGDGVFQGFRFLDVVDGHCWLVIGTDRMDDYYPCYVFTYEPKKPD